MFKVFMTYRKIPKISPGAFIFQRSSEWLMFGAAYIKREIWKFSKSSRLILGKKSASKNRLG